MSYTLSLTAKTEAPYSADELDELTSILTEAMTKFDGDVDGNSVQLDIHTQEDLEEAEAEKKKSIIEDVLKNSSMTVSVVLENDDFDETIMDREISD